MADQEFGRRAMLELLGGIALLAACSDTSTTTHPTTSPHPGGGPSTGNPSGGPSGTLSPGESATTINASGKKLAPSARSTAAELASERRNVNGTWLGSWRDDKDRRGNIDGIFDIDVDKRSIDFTLKLDGPFLGATAPTTTTYHIDADALAKDPEDLPLTSPLVGDFDLQFLGFREFQITATHVAGHPDITSFVVKGAWEGLDSGTMNYTVEGTGDAAGRGTVAWKRGGPRAIAPKPGDVNDITSFLQGDYAASLIHTDEATRILGQPCKPPEANGGKLNYRAGINISNARVDTIADILKGTGAAIQYSIYRAHDTNSMDTFLHEYDRYLPFPELGPNAKTLTAVSPTRPLLYGLDIRKNLQMLDISLVDPHAATNPTQYNAKLIAVAKTILGRMP